MKPGDTSVIEYLSGTREHFTASLTDMRDEFPSSVTDPDFIHTGPNGAVHRDVWINYIAWDGNSWWAKCHSHSSPVVSDTITFTFEHFRDPNGDPDHEVNLLGFLSWDNSRWLATVPNIQHGLTPHFNVTQH